MIGGLALVRRRSERPLEKRLAAEVPRSLSKSRWGDRSRIVRRFAIASARSGSSPDEAGRSLCGQATTDAPFFLSRVVGEDDDAGGSGCDCRYGLTGGPRR